MRHWFENPGQVSLSSDGSTVREAEAGAPFTLSGELDIRATMVFAPALAVTLRRDNATIFERWAHNDGLKNMTWLPHGRYRVYWSTPRLNLPEGHHKLRLAVWGRAGDRSTPLDALESDLNVRGGDAGTGIASAWHIETVTGPAIDELSWAKGSTNWFHRHFDHAARIVTEYMLGNSPQLKGRILDVGCGEGITDLAIALRCQPELLVGIDPFRGYQRLPEVMRANHLPLDTLPENLVFRPDDGNDLPFADDSFDVVISWGSLEHVAGGYLGTLDEIRRVLRDGGLLFAHPGLYYSNFGHHLGEFSDEPFVHLKHGEQALKRIVMTAEPRLMDRSGYEATREEYWQWYKELNKITVTDFERQLRGRGFEPWRVAIRTEDRFEYTPEILDYPMQDLATLELYLSAINRKSDKPGNKPGLSDAQLREGDGVLAAPGTKAQANNG